jgi:hypothetical protein
MLDYVDVPNQIRKDIVTAVDCVRELFGEAHRVACNMTNVGLGITDCTTNMQLFSTEDATTMVADLSWLAGRISGAIDRIDDLLNLANTYLPDEEHDKFTQTMTQMIWGV